MYGKEFEGVVRSSVLIDPKVVVKAAWPKAPARATPQRSWRRCSGLPLDGVFSRPSLLVY